jgi:hypothetical protein
VSTSGTTAVLILFALGIGLTAWPSGQVGVAIAALALLWLGGVVAARQSGPIIRFGGSFFLAAAMWVALGFVFPGSFDRWPKDGTAASTDDVLSPASLTDDRYKGLVALNATVRSTGTLFVVTNDTAQPWQDVKVAIIGANSEEYDFELPELAAGQSANAPAVRFTTSKGGRFNPQRAMPRTLIVTAEIGAGGPTGVYAARL